MMETDEFFLQQDPPMITKREIEELLAGNKKRPLNQSHVDTPKAKKMKDSSEVDKTSTRPVTRLSKRKKK